MQTYPNNDKQMLVLAGTVGLDLADVRLMLPQFQNVPDDEVSEELKKGQTFQRIKVSVKLNSIIDHPDTPVKDMIASLNYLKTAKQDNTEQAAGDNLIQLLRKTVPVAPPDTYNGEYDEEDEND